MNSTDNILVVDDDPRIRELLRTSLESESFVVHEANSSSELYAKLKNETVDLITMDVMLERENGLDLVRDIRKISEVPIILVTGRVDLIDTVVGLELGADDYVTKPFLIRELIARVRSVLRRSRSRPIDAQSDARPTATTNSKISASESTSLELIRFGDWSINTASRELRNSDKGLINLTTTEFDLLEIFVNSPQRVLSREHLMERLTGKNWHPSDRIIDNHVAQLRKKIELNDGTEWIKTVRGAGYMFTGKTMRDSVPD
ncbi:MAG: response regulator transcription factor [Granulosicoccus sp.]